MYVILFRFLRNVSVTQKDGGAPLEFNTDGSLKSVEMRIMNLQMDIEASKAAGLDGNKVIKRWEEIGVWQATPLEDPGKDGGGEVGGKSPFTPPYTSGM
jgi:hypothetical protein